MMIIRQNDSNIAAICMFKTKKVSYLLGLLVKWSDIAKELSDFLKENVTNLSLLAQSHLSKTQKRG